MAFALQCFHQALMLVGFYANQDYIARTSCINKARPQMHCNGKCQLMKKMQQEERQEKEDAARKGENKNEIISSKSFYPQLPGCLPRIIVQYFPRYASVHITQSAPAIFHPPQV